MSYPDPAYIAQPPIQQYFVNKTDGTPLAGGIVKYYRDVARTIPKSVYIQQQQPDNSYIFVDIGNEITLSNVGTPQYLGTDFIPFTWPYLGSPTDTPPSTVVDLYFVQVYSSGAVLQETRSAWPPNVQGSTNPTDTFEGSENAISNPQFVKVLFAPNIGASTFTLSVSGTGTETEIAPGWSLITSGTDTITLQQLDISDANVDSNPPYALAIQSGASITSMKLRQKFNETPRLFANGFVNGSVLAASTGSSALSLTLTYTQSNGSSFAIVTSATTTDNLYSTIQGTKEITPVTSSDAAPTGYSTLDITLPLGSLIKLTSVQLVTVQNASSKTEFLQETVDRQVDHLFHYYKPQLDYKPIPSYLVGWDFVLNPAQPLGSTVAAQAVGANKSYYAWDQTILFQSANSGISTARTSNGNLSLTANNTTQMAVIQYLSASQAQAVFLQAATGNLSVNIRLTSTASQNMTVSLWWSAAAPPLTTMTANNSLVTGLDANGYPTVAAGWTEITRDSLGKAQFSTSAGGAAVDHGFSGFRDTNAQFTGTFFAIVVGTSSITAANALEIISISLVPGLIPTIPAPQSPDEVLRECQYYYQKSFQQGTTPASNIGAGKSETYGLQAVAGAASNWGPIIRYPVQMRAIATSALYNPGAAGVQIRNIDKSTDWTNSIGQYNTTWGFVTSGTGPAGSAVGDLAGVNWTSDARIGIV